MSNDGHRAQKINKAFLLNTLAALDPEDARNVESAVRDLQVLFSFNEHEALDALAKIGAALAGAAGEQRSNGRQV